MTKTASSAAFAAVLALLAAGPATAAPAAKMQAAYSVDDDGDGHVDGVALTWSRKLRGGADRRAPFAFSVRGYRVTRVVRARGRSQRLHVAERAECDIGAAVAIRHGRRRLDMRRFDPAVPRITCAVTRDVDGDARVDGLRLTYSRAVRSRAQRSGAFLFSALGYRVTGVDAAKGRFLDVRLAEHSAPDSGVTPIVGYTQPRSKGERPYAIRAGRGTAFPGTYAGTRDGVAPRLLAARTGDGDRDGLLDTVAARFSEPMQAGSAGALAVLGMKVRATTPSGSWLVLSLVEGTARGDARPGVWTTGAALRDASGNQAIKGAVAAADGAAPVVVGAMTQDAGWLRGRIDTIAVRFSEPVVHWRDTGGTYPFAVAGRHVTAVEAASDRDVQVRIAEASAADTGARPQVTHTPGAGEAVTDAAGNPAVTASATPVDGVAPLLLSATTADGDSDGLIDSLALLFSENVQHAAEAAQASFTVAGYGVTGAAAAAGARVTLAVAESGAPDSGARPAVAYVPDGQEDVRDATGNLAPAASALQAADGARPVLTGAQTTDGDDDGRLDGVATTWSEPLAHADDAAAPFPLSAQGFAVTRIRATADQTLAIDLAEPGAADTGSAPQLAYDGGADPLLDAAGLEPERKAHAGVTRDALPPRLVDAATADADLDGKIDSVDLDWSEQVTGTTGTAPYTVAGRTLGANATFSGAQTRIPFAEAGSGYDTDDRPAVSYDAAVGDLQDVAEGAGDTSAAAPAVSALTPADRAAPILVAAKTNDLSTPAGGNVPNGTIDAVLATFSEPIAHSIDGIAPFSLNVAGRTETQVEGDSSPTDRSLYVTVAESGAPDGGYRPDVSVVSAGPQADWIADRAATPNTASPMTLSGTTDEVRPVLLSAQLGERGSSGGCTKTAVAGIDGQVDCVVTTWSEPVRHDDDGDGTYSVQSSGWGVAAGGIGQLGPSATLEVLLAPAASPDRDRTATTVSYDGAIDTPVVDAASAPNEALDGTKAADPACRDAGQEGNDARDGADPLLLSTSPAFERKCAFDHDWYRVTTDAGSDYLQLVTRPVAGVDVQLELVDSGGAVVAGPGVTAEPGGAGQIDKITAAAGGPLAPSTTYWAHVTANDAPAPQEGPYCVVFSSDPASEAGCGPLVGQLVFTEAGVGSDKFLEIKNDFDVPVEMQGAGAKLVFGTGGTRRECTLAFPTGGDTMIDPGEHVVVAQAPTATAFGCDQVSSLAAGGERIEISASGAIDVVDLAGVIASPVAAEHSLQYVEDELTQDHVANDDVAMRWCRTFAASTKGAAGDGCDEYRINEVLWKPTSSAATSDGRAFVEIAGNLPALAGSKLLGGWIVRGVNGLTGDGTSDLVLAASASPRPNGTYVVADGVGGATQVASSDRVWDLLDLNSPNWPDATGSYGPRGLQLLRPGAGGSPPCTASVDAFGWTATAQGFAKPLDDMRSCPGIEGQEYTNSTVGASAARDNLSSAGDTTYNPARDSNQNRGDFCPQAAPNPGELNIRPSC